LKLLIILTLITTPLREEITKRVNAIRNPIPLLKWKIEKINPSPNTSKLIRIKERLTPKTIPITKGVKEKKIPKRIKLIKIQLAKVLNKILTKIKLILELKGVKLTKINKGKSLINLKSNRKALKSLTKANSYIQ
jgi:hypothetical protein